MNKDVIYIDVDDDITAIIGKVKDAKARVVALVPPKRIGILQSAVNLRLLARAADSADKRLVLITGAPQLQALAAVAKIPIAKNLQSKPEIAPMPVLDIDDDEDIIDGEKLPVGELAKTAESDLINVNREEDNTHSAPVAAIASAAPSQGAKARRTGKPKVPNFNTFRKKLVIFGGLGALLIGFLVWAIWFAPQATIVISARTTDSAVNGRVALSSGQATDFGSQTIKATVEETSKETSLEFDATGTEERGEKATGTMTLSRGAGGSVQVPAGTSFSSGDFTFVSTESVVVPGASLAIGSTQIVPGTADVAVIATNIGSDYNLTARSYQSSVNGVSARGSQMSGGSKETVKIVTAEDMQAAREKLMQQNTDAVKRQLKEKFAKSAHVIDGSFVVTPRDPTSTVEVGEEAPNGKATLKSAVYYRLSGLAEDDLKDYLEQALESKISDNSEQRVYDTGAKSVKLTDFKSGDAGDSVALSATGKIGPKIDEDNVKQTSRGQGYGDVQEALESINGISSVDVKFWPFWVRTVPNDIEKITVEFKLENNG